MNLKTLEKFHNETLEIINDSITAEITNNNEGCMIAILSHLTADIYDLLSVLGCQEIGTSCQLFLGSIAREIRSLFLIQTEQRREMLTLILTLMKSIDELKESYR